jgi:hypothetical protein
MVSLFQRKAIKHIYWPSDDFYRVVTQLTLPLDTQSCLRVEKYTCQGHRMSTAICQTLSVTSGENIYAQRYHDMINAIYRSREVIT